MPKTSEITNPYFSHDMSARNDEKIIKMMFDFRKEYGSGFPALAAYGIFWSIVEYMHRNPLKVEDAEILADELRIDVEIINKVLNNYRLFHIEDGYYVSDRICKNLCQVEEKQNKLSEAASKRWSLSNLKKVYNEIFEKTPTLNQSEISIFLDYQKKIDNFKELLPDILYTLSKLKFDNNPNFTPSINWLLEDNNLPKLLNGQYGKMRSWQKHLEFIKRKQDSTSEQAEEFEHVDIDFSELRKSIFAYNTSEQSEAI